MIQPPCDSRPVVFSVLFKTHQLDGYRTSVPGVLGPQEKALKKITQPTTVSGRPAITTPANPFAKPMNIVDALTSTPPAPDHVLPGLLSGSVGMLVGPGGIGKSMLELQVAVSVALGLPPLDGAMDGWCDGWSSDKPQKVTVVFAEEPLDVVWRRLHTVVHAVLARATAKHGTSDEALRVLQENLQVFPLGGGHRISLMSDSLEATAHLHQLEEACEGTRLAMLDPLRQLHRADENDSTAMNALVQLLQGVAHRTRAALIFSHHTSRAAQQGTGAEAAASRGSTALTDGVRWQMNMAESRRSVTVNLLVNLAKQNYIASPPAVAFCRSDGGLLVASRAVSAMAPSVAAGVRKSKRQGSATWVRRCR